MYFHMTRLLLKPNFIRVYSLAVYPQATHKHQLMVTTKLPSYLYVCILAVMVLHHVTSVACAHTHTHTHPQKVQEVQVLGNKTLKYIHLHENQLYCATKWVLVPTVFKCILMLYAFSLIIY